jgi:thioredoxin-like negative regulator of GroEL
VLTQGHPIKFAKFNCGTQDKRFAIEKGIKALPTFHMYRANEKQGEFVGAKPAALRKFVEQHIDVC